MVREVHYISIRRVLDNLKDDENMQNLTLEQTVRHTIRFMEKFGFPQMYEEREAVVDIHEFRGVLPCDAISITQVKDCKTGLCMRSMTNTFKYETPDGEPFRHPLLHETSWKAQNRIIYTSFPEGEVKVAYRATMTDEDGFPMVLDDEVYLDALESYITMKVYTAKFRAGKLSGEILKEVQQAYAVAAKLLETEFSTPSVSEMETLTREWNTLIPRVRQFDRGFRRLGNREYIRRH